MADQQNGANNSASASGQSEAGSAAGNDKKGLLQKLGDGGYGDTRVSGGGIAVTTLILMSLVVVLLLSITRYWPVCDFPDDNQNNNANASTRNSNAAATTTNANGNTSRSENANSSTTQNTGASSTTNTNSGANTSAGTPTNPPATENAANGGTPQQPNPSGTPGETAAQPGVDANSIEPKAGSTTGKTLAIIKGKDFGTKIDDVNVNFGEAKAIVSQVTDDTISVSTPRHSEGVVDVSVQKGGQNGPKDVLLSAYTYTCPAPAGTDLFMMIIMAGALGGCIHALRSLYWYAGQRELKWSWLPMYFALPFVGAAMAMIFSMLIAAGLIDNTSGRNQSLFIIAVAGLVGMFSQQAALKLTDIANAIFTKPGAGKDAEPQKSESVGAGAQAGAATLTATEMDKNAGTIGGGDEVTIKGTGFSDATSVLFDSDTAEVKAGSVTPTSITVVTPRHAAGEVDVIVKSGNLSATVPGKFTYI